MRIRIGLGLGDAPLRHLAGPFDRARVVAPPQPAAGGVVGVVGRQPRIAVVELFEQLPGVGPVRLVGARQRQEVGRRQPLVAAAWERLQRAHEPRLGAAPVLAAELFGGRLGGAVLEEWLQPVAVERDRLAGMRRGRDRGSVGFVIAADRLRERRVHEGQGEGCDEDERERRRDRRAASDGHTNRLRTTRATCKKEGQVSRAARAVRRLRGATVAVGEGQTNLMRAWSSSTSSQLICTPRPISTSGKLPRLDRGAAGFLARVEKAAVMPEPGTLASCPSRLCRRS